jgi:hypothetical protein
MKNPLNSIFKFKPKTEMGWIIAGTFGLVMLFIMVLNLWQVIKVFILGLVIGYIVRIFNKDVRDEK